MRDQSGCPVAFRVPTDREGHKRGAWSLLAGLAAHHRGEATPPGGMGTFRCFFIVKPDGKALVDNKGNFSGHDHANSRTL
jgi:hypothetical protein